ncbi:MAG: glycoside hydrolase family 15 protein [Promethearchaeota archaeon]
MMNPHVKCYDRLIGQTALVTGANSGIGEAASVVINYVVNDDAALEAVEERYGIHSFTVASVHAGLVAAGNFSRLFGDNDMADQYFNAAGEVKAAMVEFLYEKEKVRFLRTITFDRDGNVTKDYNIDASLYGIFEFGTFPAGDPLVVSTMKKVRSRLWINTDVGGMARYEDDYYHRCVKSSSSDD